MSGSQGVARCDGGVVQEGGGEVRQEFRISERRAPGYANSSDDLSSVSISGWMNPELGEDHNRARADRKRLPCAGAEIALWREPGGLMSKRYRLHAR